MKQNTFDCLKKSFYFSFGYVLFCSFYIWLSGNIASRITTTVENLAHIEFVKGIIFILVTGLILFLYLFYIIRKVTIQNTTIYDQQQAIGEKECVIKLQSEAILNQKKIVSDYERQALAGTYAASIGHDINNYLTICYFCLSELQEQNTIASENKKLICNLENTLAKIETCAKTLKVIGRKQINYDVSEFNISKLTEDTIELTKKHKYVRNCHITSRIVPAIFVQSNAGAIEQCLINLILNAADAVKRTGNIEVRLLDALNHVLVEVHDNGTGVQPENRQTIFQAYVTDKEHGTGLGLAGVKMSMELLKGDVTVNDSPLGGAVFTLRIPKSMI